MDLHPTLPPEDAAASLLLEHELLGLRCLRAILATVVEHWPAGALTVFISTTPGFGSKPPSIRVEGYSTMEPAWSEQDPIPDPNRPDSPWAAFTGDLVSSISPKLNAVFGSFSTRRSLTREELAAEVAVPLAERASPALRELLQAQALRGVLETTLPAPVSRPRGRV